MSSGTVDKAKGRLKEAAGALADDQKLKHEGKADQVAGKMKATVERVVDKGKDLVKQRRARSTWSARYLRAGPFVAR